MVEKNKIILIGYSGHAFVVADCLLSQKREIIGYCDNEEKTINPFEINYLGKETGEAAMTLLKENGCFISIGNNAIRAKIFKKLQKNNPPIFVNAIHNSAIISPSVMLGKAILISPNATINAMAKIGDGVICNTGCIIEHECQIGDFAHIAPSATLAGNVTIGEGSFVGANAVIRQGIVVGKNVTIGAGAVIIQDVPNDVTIVGNPGKIIKQNL